ncbi:hypothetical protein I302_100521 [Kwoniella bestiolae CBS 10118]|uniref:J domain-containing protein n=1 Tax=Kwoniella bestiolae CBS 10118 TaxID=1296100 RepID=A0A1B9G5B2_9TREE|nr:hypothetical protein I302_03894 [Kwoniella bestiolae CBS 10118]OCF26215.1 hypothetical protein I302_03894 [Kwoniella bestiolae CBS 10118]
MSSLRAYARPHLISRVVSCQHITCRYAQTASASFDSESSSSSSSSSSAQYSYTRRKANEEPSNSDSRKGKGRSNSLADTYVFPEKGRLGGPPDPFEVMALERGATESEVKKQYYKLALLLHPDSSHPSSSHDHFSTLNRAYTLLSTPSSRSAYLKTGYGWNLPSQFTPNRPPGDYSMHEEIMRRAKGGTSNWEKRKYRDGSPDWGGFDGSKGWKGFNDQTMNFDQNTFYNGTGEERYMSNPRFLFVLGIVGSSLAWMQYHRLGTATETHRDLLDRQNTDASHALAQARYEAAIHGKTRREQIRRRVREAEIMKELEKIESGQVTPHLAIAAPPPESISNDR